MVGLWHSLFMTYNIHFGIFVTADLAVSNPGSIDKKSIYNGFMRILKVFRIFYVFFHQICRTKQLLCHLILIKLTQVAIITL